ncbi:MAG TPA: 3-phosphoshikimate 1-carboxyvinyltransferase [Nitrospirae bacterium]|nr:3-phosphoshikimate 1-carboxyvinyltransferase [Nitrospirota bacterium]
MDSSAEVNIRQDPFIEGMLSRMSKDVSGAFSDDQLLALKMALSGRKWGTHAVDIRRSIGFWRWRYYLVLVAGKERRAITDRQQRAVRFTLAVFITIFFSFSTLMGLGIAYIIKSSLGIDIIPSYSLGLWDWFRDYISQ